MARITLSFGCQTDIGMMRDHNEDAVGFKLAKDAEEAESKGDMFIVADGMGGHAAGEVASAIARDVITNEYYSSLITNSAYSLKNAIEMANSRIVDEASSNEEKRGMGTTVVCTVFRGNQVFLAHVGDSRAYRFRNGELSQLTTDHSLVQDQILRGYITEEQAKVHPMRNVLTRALGTSPTVQIDLSIHDVNEGDVFILCSDGLTNAITDTEIREILVANPEPTKAASEMIEAANTAGGPDNISAIVIRVGAVEEKQGTTSAPAHNAYRRSSRLKKLPIIGAALILVIGLLIFTSSRVNSPSQEEVPAAGVVKSASEVAQTSQLTPTLLQPTPEATPDLSTVSPSSTPG